MLNRILVPFFIILTTALIAQTTVSPDWNNCTADSSQGIVKLMQSRRYAGAIAVKPKELADHLKYNFKDGRLEIDTREVFKQPGIKAVILRLRSWKPNTEYLLKNCYLDMSIASTPGGLNATMYFEGNTGANKKHYWKAKKFIAENTPEIIHFEQVLPQDLNGLTLRCDLKQPGIYSIGKVTFGKVKEKKIDAAKNHIVNGGAEREWYNIGTIGAKIMAMWDDNIIYNGTGKTFHKEDKFEIDSKVKHSGRNAFRIRSDQDSTGRFAFNSVPFTPGKPATFAVWLKADKPNTKVRLSMFLGSGIAYVKHINVGTGWKQYTQTVPVFGDKVRGMNRVGDPINGNCAVFRRLTPLIFIKNGTLWIDDATYQQSLKAIPVKSPKLSVSGYLNNKAAYYKSGQKISATLKLLSDNNETVPVSWEVYDFFGKIVSRNNAGNVTLKAGKPQTMIYDLKLSEKLRGPMNWTFILGNVRHNLYFGVIEKSPNRSQRLGINYSSRQNTKVAIPMLKDFGFGSVRLWSAFRKLPFHGFRDTSIFHENDFYVMMCISSLIPVAPSCLVPNDLTEWADLVVKNVKEVKGQVDCYEILNEPNIWNGRHKNPDEKKFREMTPAVNAEIIKFIAKKIRTVDNKVKISGPTSCHTDVSWTASILKNGASKYLDIITEHPYRDQPELPDYAEDLEKMHKLLGRYRSNFPIIASEAGARSIAMPPDNLIIDCMRKASAYNSRMMLIGLANGLKQYHHFCMNMAEVGTGWGMTLAGNLDSDGLSLPAPVMFALRNLVDRIGEGKPAGRVKLGNSYRCYIFDKGKNRVAAVWKWHGAPSKLTIPATGEIKAYDIMGTPVSAKELVVNEYPLYLESGLSAEKLGKVISSGLSQSNTFPLNATLIIKGAKSVGFKLSNLTGTAVSGKLEVLTSGVFTGKKTVAIPTITAESNSIINFNAIKAIGPRSMPVKIKVSDSRGKSKEFVFDLRSILVPYAAKKLTIDGNLADWPKTAKPVMLDSSNAKKLKGWTAPFDQIKAEVLLAWDDEYLYVAVSSNKKTYAENSRSSGSMWRGDGLQIAYDPLHNAVEKTTGYQDDDYEFSIGRFKGKPLVYMHCASAATYDSLDKPIGFVPGVKRAIKTTKNGTVYELAFPRILVSPFRLEPDSSMRFNLILNINNGKKRVGWLELTPGIGQTPKKPGLFMDIVLTK